MISISHDSTVATLDSGTVSYVLEVVDGKYLVHRYYGRHLRSYHGCGEPTYYKRSYSTTHDCTIPNVSFDDFPFEYPVRGRGDFRIPALTVQRQDGVCVAEPLFRSWRVLDGKPALEGLPSTFAGDTPAQTLEVVCEDAVIGLRVYLYYTVLEGLNVVARHQRFENIGQQELVLCNALSASLELPAQPYEFLTLYGTHAKEANLSRSALHHGVQQIESAHGSSSPQHQPFFALVSPGTNETQGEVYAMHLCYSGNFVARAEMDSFGNVRAQIGIHPETFRWQLKPGGQFTTPEAILNYSASGLNGMSQQFHKLYREHLMPRRFAGLERPVLLNSWESMYYDVTFEKIEQQAELARQLGVELFALDDGWFRADNSSYTSMGDWSCNEAKLPGGIHRVAECIHGKGMKFGLWFEPEAVCKNSALYHQHPDWTLHIPGYDPLEGRHEYLLDLGRTEVQNYLWNVLDSHLKTGEIDYIKWDMNRPLTDVDSAVLAPEQKGEAAHRYILGLYALLEKVTSAYPHLLIEGCSSGGARFDPGMLYYVAQNWTSDNTDALDRSVIQNGFSLLYPPVAMGAHVSIAPNHQTGRVTPLDTRYQIARLFNLGYEIDLTRCTEEERAAIQAQIATHKAERSWMQNAAFYRHDTGSDNYVMWSLVREDRGEVQAVIFQKHYDPLVCHTRFHFLGLDPQADYRDTTTGEVYGGDELMQIGLSVPLVKEDYHTFAIHFEKAGDSYV